MQYTLRRWKWSDKQSLVHHANNLKIARYMRNGFTHPYTEDTADGFLGVMADNKDAHVFAIVIGGQAVGGIGLHPLQDIHCRNAEIGYWLNEEFWDRGIITNAVIEIADYGWKHLDVDRIFASVFGSNIGSQHVMMKAGFILEATLNKTVFKMGEYEDELIYGLRRKVL